MEDVSFHLRLVCVLFENGLSQYRDPSLYKARLRDYSVAYL